MDDSTTNLGLCFFSDRLFYAVNNPAKDGHLTHIGSFNFNFDVVDALATQNESHFPQLLQATEKLISEYGIQSVRALTYPANECWTVLPKVVYDNADEREDHLSIIMKGVDRQDVEPTWHSVSKNQYKFLCIRRRHIMNGYDAITQKIATTDFISDFELAGKWSAFNKPGGSYMMIGCHKHVLSVTSFMLGKFRAATYLKYDQLEDLPYHWLQQASHSSWLKGLHEKTYLFGAQAHKVEHVLTQFLDASTHINRLNSLGEIGVFAEEQTYGFNLAEAFPAILLSLE